MGVAEKEDMLNSLLFGEGEQNNYEGVYDYFMRWLIILKSIPLQTLSANKYDGTEFNYLTHIGLSFFEFF